MKKLDKSSRAKRLGKTGKEVVMGIAARDSKSFRNMLKRPSAVNPSVKFFEIGGIPHSMRNGKLVPMTRKSLATVFFEVENFGLSRAMRKGLIQLS